MCVCVCECVCVYVYVCVCECVCVDTSWAKVTGPHNRCCKTRVRATLCNALRHTAATHFYDTLQRTYPVEQKRQARTRYTKPWGAYDL